MMIYRKIKVFVTYLLFAITLAINPAFATEQGIQSFGSVRDGVRHVNASEANEILKNNPKVQVLDVRTGIEYKFGHLPESVQINYYSWQFESMLNELDKNVTWLVHCRTGVRSGKTLPIMASLGFTSVIHLDGGIVAWTDGGFDLVDD